MPRLLPSALLITLLTACSASDESGHDAASFTFTMDFWADVASDGGKTSDGGKRAGVDRREALTDQHVLDNGSAIGLTLDPGGGHVYLVYQDTEGALEVLYSSQDQRAGAVALFPPGAALDDQPGHERFCVIASEDRLADLEAAITAYRTRPTEAKAALLEQVSLLRARYESQESAPPRPVTIGGQVRGDSPNAPASTARAYPVTGVRCHTITLEHR